MALKWHYDIWRTKHFFLKKCIGLWTEGTKRTLGSSARNNVRIKVDALLAVYADDPEWHGAKILQRLFICCRSANLSTPELRRCGPTENCGLNSGLKLRIRRRCWTAAWHVSPRDSGVDNQRAWSTTVTHPSTSTNRARCSTTTSRSSAKTKSFRRHQT